MIIWTDDETHSTGREDGAIVCNVFLDAEKWLGYKWGNQDPIKFDSREEGKKAAEEFRAKYMEIK